MLVIESDVIPPPKTLRRLAALPADVAYGTYLYRPGNQINVTERYYAGTAKRARNMGEPLTARGLYAAAVEQGVIECSGAGLGCVLIRRQVLETTPFEAREGGGFCDHNWTQAVYEQGYRMMADMAVECGHVDVDGTVLWPSSKL